MSGSLPRKLGVSLLRTYRKKDCIYCQGNLEGASPIMLGKNIGAFYLINDPATSDPLVVYAWHNQPSEADKEYVYACAEQEFPKHMIDRNPSKRIKHFNFRLMDRRKYWTGPNNEVLHPCARCGYHYSDAEMIKRDGKKICQDCARIILAKQAQPKTARKSKSEELLDQVVEVEYYDDDLDATNGQVD